VGEPAHEAVSRRPPVSLDTVVARARMYTYAAEVWALSIVQGPFSLRAPCGTFVCIAVGGGLRSLTLRVAVTGAPLTMQVDPPTRTVVVEVMGRHSNVITINGDAEILSCAYQTGQAQTRVRPLAVGGSYTLPPVADGLQPSLDEPLAQWAANVRQVRSLHSTTHTHTHTQTHTHTHTYIHTHAH
jgi:hypothetical protein